MIIKNNEINNSNNDHVQREPYELTTIISPIFGLDYQKNSNNKDAISMITINEDIDKITEKNVLDEKVIAKQKNPLIKNKEQQIEFHKKMLQQTVAINYNNTNSNDTYITTIDLLIDDILDENK